jgi:hypothetical protein
MPNHRPSGAPEASSSIAVMQVVSLEANLVVPPTVELVTDHRILLSPPHGQRRTVGEPLHALDPARVSCRSVPAGGRRWLGAVDRDLIEWSPSPRTGSAFRVADRWARAVSASGQRPARPRFRSGPAQCGAAWVCSDLARDLFFSEYIDYAFPEI